MLIRKPLPLWISVSLFAVAVTMIPLTGQVRHQPVSPPDTLAEMAARLSQCTPPLHIVPNPNRPEGSIWVCVQPRSQEDLRGLVCDPKRVQAGRWQGIVHCQRMGSNNVIFDDFIRDNWGECGMRIGSTVFFGDPELLQRIRVEMSDH